MHQPEAEVRDIIANSLHEALLRFMQPSIMHIGPINTIGCFLLKYLTGSAYTPVAGSVEVRCGGSPFGIHAHIENIDIHAYYVWIECDRGPDGIELVDFGPRYWKAWAAEEGVFWTAPPPAPFIWGVKSEWEHMAEYTPHAEISTLVRHAIENAISAPKPEKKVDQWETAVNDAINRMMDSEIGLRFLVDSGIAKPVDEEESEEPFQ